jgi:uncharacterized protein with HEPN domain
MIRDDKVYLAHILDAVQQIVCYTAEKDYEQFRASRLVQDAVIRQFEIIGEAAKNVSSDFRNRYTNIPWKDLAGFRDKLIHQYFGVDIATVWRSVQDDMPVLMEELRQIK